MGLVLDDRPPKCPIRFIAAEDRNLGLREGASLQAIVLVEPAEGSVKVYRLTEPARVQRVRMTSNYYRGDIDAGQPVPDLSDPNGMTAL